MNKDDLEFDREFNLKPEDAAEILRDMADSIEEQEEFILDGDGFKLFQPLEGNIPMRITKDLSGMEVGFKMISPSQKED